MTFGRAYVALGFVVLLVAGFLRFYHLGERSLWLDEARVANYAGQSLTDNVLKTRLGSSSPVTYPLLLQAVRLFADTPFAVRLISAVSSLMAVFVILMLVRVGVDRSGALIAAAILAVSPSQTRYAQEVREYALGVLLASLMIFAFLKFWRDKKGVHGLLLASLFFAPLVQYGLVFLAVALLVVMASETWWAPGRTVALKKIAGASGLFVTGAMITVALTLRGQWGRGGMSYLDSCFFRGSLSDLGAGGPSAGCNGLRVLRRVACHAVLQDRRSPGFRFRTLSPGRSQCLSTRVPDVGRERSPQGVARLFSRRRSRDPLFHRQTRFGMEI